MEYYEITNSSNIKAVSYEAGTLQVEFKNNRVYEYSNVPDHLFRLFLKAPSKGSFLHERIIDAFPTRRLY